MCVVGTCPIQKDVTLPRRLRGMQLSLVVALFPRPESPNARNPELIKRRIQWLAREWHVNVLRIFFPIRGWCWTECTGKRCSILSPSDFESFLHSALERIPGDAWSGWLTDVINYCEAEGIWVMPACNVHEWMSQPRDKSFWREWRWFVRMWAGLARRWKRHRMMLFDFLNEPHAADPKDWDGWASKIYHEQMLPALWEAVREVDEKRYLVIEPGAWNVPEAYDSRAVNSKALAQLRSDKRVLWSVHFYSPHLFTHQRLHREAIQKAGLSRPLHYPSIQTYPDEAWQLDHPKYWKRWNIETLKQVLAPVAKFQKRYGVRIVAGEFGCANFPPASESRRRWFSDCLRLFEQHGWDWIQFEHDWLEGAAFPGSWTVTGTESEEVFRRYLKVHFRARSRDRN